MANQLKDLSLATGATVSSTGGTALTVGILNNGQNNQVILNVSSDPLKTMRRFTFSATPPKPSTTNPSGFTLARRQVYMTFPRTLASGVVVLDKAIATIEFAQDTATSDVNDMRKHIAQAMIDSDLDGFWQAGSLA